MSPAEPLVQHSQGLEECSCREGACKDLCKEGKGCNDGRKRRCKEGGCEKEQVQGDQAVVEEGGKRHQGEEEEGAEKHEEDDHGDEEVDDGDEVLVRVRYRGETRLLRPRGGKLELDSLQLGDHKLKNEDNQQNDLLPGNDPTIQ